MKYAKQCSLHIKKIIQYLLILLSLVISINIFAKNDKYITYKVQKNDTIEKILRKKMLTPIYGKNGYLYKLLKINPKISKEKGNLIFPNDVIVLPIIDNSIVLERNENEFSTSVVKPNYTFFDLSDNEDYVYMLYTVQKGDMISMLLKDLKAFPIYGKNGFLSSTLHLNPNKMKTNGNLIYPNEKIILFIPIEIALKILKDQENNVLILKFKPNSQNNDFFKNKDNFYTYDELFQNYQSTHERKKTKQNIEKNTTDNKIETTEKQKDDPELYNNTNLNNIKINPIFLNAVIENNVVRLSWDNKNKDISNIYEIKRSLKSKNSYYSINKNNTKYSYLDSKIGSGTQYFYTVILHYGKSMIKRSNEVSIVIPPLPPKLSAILKNGFVQLKWEFQKTSANFQFEILKSNNLEKTYSTLKQNYFYKIYTDKNTTKGNSYFYKIKAYHKNGTFSISNKVKITISHKKPELYANLNDNSVNLSWTQNQGNSPLKYIIKRSLKSRGPYKIISENISENNFIDDTIQKGYSYFYIVSAYDDQNIFIESNEIKIGTPPPIPYNLIGSLDKNNNVNLSWSISNGNNPLKFRVKRSLKSGKEFEIIQDNITDISTIDFEANKGQKYYYSVSALDANGASQDSFEISLVTPPPIPTGITVELIGKIIILKWDANKSNIETKFQIKRASQKEDNFIYLTEENKNNEYSDNSILPEETYYYVISSENEGGRSLDSIQVAINSHNGEHTANSLEAEFGASFYTFKEYDNSAGSYIHLYSSASPFFEFKHIHNWSDNFVSYFNLGLVYLDVMKSPIYHFSQRQFYLFHANIGIKHAINSNWYIINEYGISENIVFQAQGFNDLNSLVRNYHNAKILGGYTFYKYNSLKAQIEAGYLLNIPINFAMNYYGSGYELSLKLFQQNSNFGIGTKFFYRYKQINTQEVNSRENEIGISGEIILDYGYQ